MRHAFLLSLSLALCSGACATSARIHSAPVPAAMVGSWHLDGSSIRSSGFYNPKTLDFNQSVAPGEYITLTADGHFEEGSVTRRGSGECAVARYEYHRGTVVVRDSELVLYPTAGRVRSVAPCNLRDDYEKNDTGVRTLAWHAGQTAFVREMP